MTWPLARVGDLAEQIRGVTFAKGDTSPVPAAGLLPVMTATNVTELGLLSDSVLYLPRSRVGATQVLRKNDVLVTASSGSLSVVGRAVLVREEIDATFGAFCKVLRPRDGVDPNYFAHFFRTSDYRSRVSRVAAGANINNLRNEDLDGFEIPLPPLPEQRRIASILDEVDALRSKRLGARSCTALVSDAMFSRLLETTANATTTIGESLRLSSGRFLPASAMVTGGGVEVYGGNGVAGHHNVAMYDRPKIVVGRVGAKCGVVHITGPSSWVSDNAMVVDWDGSKFDIYYLAAALRRANLNQFASQSGQPLISASRISGVELRVPTLNQQMQLRESHGAVDHLQKTMGSQSEKLDELFASLQYRAFRGEL